LFVEGSFSSAPRDIVRFSMSFDEPLASTLAAGFNHPPQSNQAIIPTPPKGTLGSKPKSFRCSFPIRTMAGYQNYTMNDQCFRLSLPFPFLPIHSNNGLRHFLHPKNPPQRYHQNVPSSIAMVIPPLSHVLINGSSNVIID
jgi:hypothetical protein